MSLIRRLWKSRHGATAIEYSLIASLLSVAIIGSAASVGVDLMGLYERELITSMLEQNHFSLTKTADQLKLSRHALRYRMQRLNITTGLEDDTSFLTKEGVR